MWQSQTCEKFCFSSELIFYITATGLFTQTETTFLDPKNDKISINIDA